MHTDLITRVNNKKVVNIDTIMAQQRQSFESIYNKSTHRRIYAVSDKLGDTRMPALYKGVVTSGLAKSHRDDPRLLVVS